MAITFQRSTVDANVSLLANVKMMMDVSVNGEWQNEMLHKIKKGIHVLLNEIKHLAISINNTHMHSIATVAELIRVLLNVESSPRK